MNWFLALPQGLQAALLLTLAALLQLGPLASLRRPVATGLGVAVNAAALLLAWLQPGIDTAAVAAVAGVTALALLVLPAAELEFAEHRLDSGAVLLLGAAGAIVLATSTHLVSLVLGLETLSLAVAVVCGLGGGNRPLEAAFKFFVLAAISLATTVYGIGLFAYATGSFELTAAPVAGLETVYQTAVVLLVAGIAFELAVVPMHFGALGAYMAMPSALAVFATTAGKLGAGLALLRVAHGCDVPVVGPILTGLGLLSIAWATLAGLAQTELRCLLAYSAIGHAGFVALAIGSGPAGHQATVFYLVAYAAASALVFAALGERSVAAIPLASLRDEPLPPGRALALTAGLLSLAGLPPSPGLWAKVAVLTPVWRHAGPWVAVPATLGAVLSALYYLRPVPDLLAGIRRPGSRPRSTPTDVAVLAAAAAVVVLTVLPWLGSRLAGLAGG